MFSRKTITEKTLNDLMSKFPESEEIAELVTTFKQSCITGENKNTQAGGFSTSSKAYQSSKPVKLKKLNNGLKEELIV